MSSPAPSPATDLDNLLLEAVRSSVFNRAAAEDIVRRGANVNAYCGSGSSALIHAAASGNKEAVDFLLDHGAEINFGRAHDNQTALMFAAWNGKYSVAERLLERGAN